MKILILGALEKEVSVLNKSVSTEMKDGFCFAKIKDNEVFTALTGVGIMNALIATYSLIEKIRPDIVINIGTAGGHTLDVNDGDIVVALIDGYDVTLKRLRKRASSIALEPANPAYETRIFTNDRVEIQGILSGLMRSY